MPSGPLHQRTLLIDRGFPARIRPLGPCPTLGDSRTVNGVTTLGLDYSAGRIAGAAIRDAGYSYVMRYLWFPGQGHAYLTADEAQDLLGAGVAIGPIFESTADRAAQGWDAGVADANTAAGQLNTVGAPGDQVVYFAVDFDASEGQQGAINDYFRGAASVLGAGRVAAYGGYWPISRLFDAGLIAYGWQTAAWSGGNVDNRISLFQRIGTSNVAGIDCDINELYKPAGLWGGEDDVAWNDQLPNPAYKQDQPGTGLPTYSAADWLTHTNVKVDALTAKVDELSNKLDKLLDGLNKG
ncbi:DUF1906 domain-containing protein [Pseudonocardiaceae bacterium YIM PH 21723]|nr:DUF1906 domain-containing protein [Pseudonocardiaceae bacterium YIM PH 21723]